MPNAHFKMDDLVEPVARAIYRVRYHREAPEQITGHPHTTSYYEIEVEARAAIRATLEAMQDRLFERGVNPMANDYIDQLIKEHGDD